MGFLPERSCGRESSFCIQAFRARVKAAADLKRPRTTIWRCSCSSALPTSVHTANAGPSSPGFGHLGHENGNENSADITGINRELASEVAVPLSKEASYRVVILCRQIAAQAHHCDRVLQQVVTVTVFSRFRSGGTARTSTRPRRSRSCGRERTSRASRGRVAARPTWLRRGRRRHSTGRRAARGLRRRALTGRRMAGRRRSGSACSASALPPRLGAVLRGTGAAPPGRLRTEGAAERRGCGVDRSLSEL